MNGELSRREFLKFSGLVLSSLAAGPRNFQDRPDERDFGPFGRVAYQSISVLDAPRLDAKTVAYRFRDELLNIYKEVTPPSGPAYNPRWYRVWGGYVHSAHVQPSRVRYNGVLDSLAEGGQLSELTVPFSQPHKYSSWAGWEKVEEFLYYYESTHWLTDIVEGPDRSAWYQITDELGDAKYYVPAIHLRPILDEELAPLSTEVPAAEKRIEVSLRWQSLTAWEGDSIAFSTQVSTGIQSATPTSGIPTTTPQGSFNVQVKMPSKHMGTSRLTDTLGDRALPGVPWTAFFTQQGHAIHGTYWHNNFGWPMSRGCINMRNQDAKWLFRWMTPVNDPGDWESIGNGTRLIIAE
ncbi:MAG: L,D-transpeptidase [Anaerolineae bacterium]|nr:L,D-transpeptidase [Anaerolineae bacterium]